MIQEELARAGMTMDDLMSSVSGRPTSPSLRPMSPRMAIAADARRRSRSPRLSAQAPLSPRGYPSMVASSIGTFAVVDANGHAVSVHMRESVDIWMGVDGRMGGLVDWWLGVMCACVHVCMCACEDVWM